MTDTAILLALGGILVLIALFLESCRRYTEPSPEPEPDEHTRFPMMEGYPATPSVTGNKSASWSIVQKGEDWSVYPGIVPTDDDSDAKQDIEEVEAKRYAMWLNDMERLDSDPPFPQSLDEDAKQAVNDRHAAQKRETAAIRAVGELGRK